MRTTALIALGVAIALLLLFGCPKKQPPAPPQLPARSAKLIKGLPIEITVQQRSTTIVPGSEGAVQITIDDITRGQVMASVAGRSGRPLIAPTSLEEGDSASFDFHDQTYYLTLKHLENDLIGEDLAVFVLNDKAPVPSASGDKVASGAAESAAAGDSPSDQEVAHIRQLIQHIGSLDGAVFIRNGEEHVPAEAVDHLQRKWDYAGEEIETAEQFIDQLASKSSTTGENYIIRLKDGSEIPAGEYLHRQLRTMKAGNDN